MWHMCIYMTNGKASVKRNGCNKETKILIGYRLYNREPKCSAKHAIGKVVTSYGKYTF